MSRQITYRDALRILGVDNSKALAVIDGLLGGGIVATAAATGHLEIAALLHVRDELVTRSQQLLSNLGQRVRGVKGKTRTDLLVAAHAVVAINAYFSVLKDAGLPIDPERLELTEDDQRRLTGAPSVSSRKLVDAMISASLPLPSPSLPFEKATARMQHFYRQISNGLVDLASGLSMWDELGETKLEQFVITIRQTVPQLAKDKYEESYRQLEAECIEFAIWADAIDNMATRYAIDQLGVAVGKSLSGLALELKSLTTELLKPGGPHRLARAYRGQLERPIVEATPGEAHIGLSIPLLGDAYVNPRCLVAECGPESRPSEEAWWSHGARWGDIQWFIASYLTSPIATQAPLVVLGQPGSGKSLLTKILASRLPDEEYMPIRVELRRVPADSSLDDQIEAALRDATGERLEWADLVNEAGDALPVLMLDGFDELLQGTGISHSNYLERIREFQRRELDNDRRVAVIVTSRTVVADRVRFPDGAIAVKLEPFDDEQIIGWLNQWNHVNVSYFAERGLQALDGTAVMRHRDLAQQPLLLMMLAFYDADGNQLQNQTERIALSELYERLLDKFIRREIAKDSPGADAKEVEGQLATELTQLAIAATAMFNRGRQFATEEELESDLTALRGEGLRPEPESGHLGRRLPTARLVLGRFFFIHESQASIDASRFSAYEFLHATFGEYLVAWLIYVTLKRTLALREADSVSMSFSSATIVDDDRLYALLSFSLLTDRLQIGIFLREMLTRGSEGRQAEFQSILRQLFRDVLTALPAGKYSAYMPRSLSVPARYAIYSANLLMLNVLASSEPTLVGNLFADAEGPVKAWSRLALLWQSQLEPSSLDGFINAVSVERIINAQGERDLTLTCPPDTLSMVGIESFANLSWTLHGEFSPGEPAVSNFSNRVIRFINVVKFSCVDDSDMLLHSLYPLLRRSEGAVGLVMSSPETSMAVSVANALITIFYEQLDEPDRRLAEQLLSPWISRFGRSVNRYVAATDTITSGTDWRSMLSALPEGNSIMDQVQDLETIGNSFIHDIGTVDYWSTMVSAISRRADRSNDEGDESSSPEFVKNVLERIDPVRIVRDDPEAAVNALRVSRKYDLIGWSADKGLSILALMASEQLSLVPQIEVEFVLERAARSGVPTPAIDVIRARWMSAGGVIEQSS